MACPPDAIVALPGERSITLTYHHDPDAGPALFRIYRQVGGAGVFGLHATTDQETFTDSGLTVQSYSYYVTTVHENPPTEYFRSAIVTATPFDDAPAPPTGLALRFSGNLYEFTWTYPAPPLPPQQSDLLGFYIETRHTPHGDWTRVTPQPLPPATRRYLGGKPQNRIFVRVVAADQTGHLTPSASDVSMNPGDFNLPLNSHHTPQNVVGVGGETVSDWTWTQAEGTSRVYRSTTSGTGHVLIAETTSSYYSFHDSGLAAGVYYYRFSGIAHDPPEESELSVEVAVTVIDTAPPPPTDLGFYLIPETYTMTGAVVDPPDDLIAIRIEWSWSETGPFEPAAAGLLAPAAGFAFSAPLPRATRYLRAVTVDATGHESVSAQVIAIDPEVLISQEPARGARFLGARGSVSATGEFVWHGT